MSGQLANLAPEIWMMIVSYSDGNNRELEIIGRVSKSMRSLAMALVYRKITLDKAAYTRFPGLALNARHLQQLEVKLWAGIDESLNGIIAGAVQLLDLRLTCLVMCSNEGIEHLVKAIRRVLIHQPLFSFISTDRAASSVHSGRLQTLLIEDERKQWQELLPGMSSLHTASIETCCSDLYLFASSLPCFETEGAIENYSKIMKSLDRHDGSWKVDTLAFDTMILDALPSLERLGPARGKLVRVIIKAKYMFKWVRKRYLTESPALC